MSALGAAGVLIAACGTGTVGVLGYGAFNPRSSLYGPVIWRGCTDGRGVALTFDDGPLPGVTDRVLDALADANVHAAFFVIGRNVRRHADIVRRMHEEGHLVGNHTLDHEPTGLLRRDAYWREQITGGARAIEDVIGMRPRLFRPPMGFTSAHVMRGVRGAHDVAVTWSRRGFDTIVRDPERLARRVLARAGPGSILAMHDGVDHERRRPPHQSASALPHILQGLRDANLHPVRLDELIGIQPYAGS